MADKHLSRLAWLVTAAGPALPAGAVMLILLRSAVPPLPGPFVIPNA